jgi:hypothetical protein
LNSQYLASNEIRARALYRVQNEALYNGFLVSKHPLLVAFVDAALDEGEIKNLGRLSTSDLQRLFNTD